MKNLKRTLALVLVFALLAGFGAGAAFTDVPLESDYAVEIGTLSSLSILKGYPEGDFRPTATLTRAEAVAVIYRMITGQTDQMMMSASTSFKDLPYDHWASGYVAFCVELGVINGYPDGTFKPSQPVTYQEFIKMLVTALGHLPTASSPISYPNGYIAIATVQQVTKGVNASGSEPATRAMVAKLSYNAMMDATYKRMQASDTNKKPTIAKDVFGILSIEGTLSEVDSDRRITVRYNGNTVGATAGNLGDPIPTLSGREWSGATQDYVGMNVSVLYKKDDVSGKVTVFGVNPVGNTILTVQAKDFVTAGSFAKYKVNGNEKELRLSANVDIYRNNYLAASQTNPLGHASLVDKEVPRTFTFISTKGGTTYDIVKVTDVRFAKVDTVTDKKIVVKFNDGTYVTMTTVDSDGKYTDVSYYSGVQKDDRVAVTLNKDAELSISGSVGRSTVESGKIERIAKMTGTLSSVMSGTNPEFTFDGTAYRLMTGALNDGDNLAAENVGKDFEIYVVPGTNFIGEATMTSEADTGQYLYVKTSRINTFDKQISAVNENGDDKIYTLSTTTNVFRDKGTDKNAVSDGGKISIGSAGHVIDGQVFGYTLNDVGEITKLTSLISNSGNDIENQAFRGYNKDTKALYYGSSSTVYLSDTSVVFVKDGNSKIHVTKGAVSSVTPTGGDTVTASVRSTSGTIPRVKAALVNTSDTAVSTPESANKNILAMLATNVSVKQEGSKYVAYASVAYGGNSPTTLYSAPQSNSSSAIAEFGNFSEGDVFMFDFDTNGKVKNGGVPRGNYLSDYVWNYEGNVLITYSQGDLLTTSDTAVYRFKDEKVELASRDAIRYHSVEAGIYKAQRFYASYDPDGSTRKIKTIFVTEERQALAAITIPNGASFKLTGSGGHVTFTLTGGVWTPVYSSTGDAAGSLLYGSSLTVGDLSNITGASAVTASASSAPASGGTGVSHSITVTFKAHGSADKSVILPVRFSNAPVTIDTSASFTLSDGMNTLTATTTNAGTTWSLSYTNDPDGYLYNDEDLTVTGMSGITGTGTVTAEVRTAAPAAGGGRTTPNITVRFTASGVTRDVELPSVAFDDKIAIAEDAEFTISDGTNTLTAETDDYGATWSLDYTGTPGYLYNDEDLTVTGMSGITGTGTVTASIVGATLPDAGDGRTTQNITVRFTISGVTPEITRDVTLTNVAFDDIIAIAAGAEIVISDGENSVTATTTRTDGTGWSYAYSNGSGLESGAPSLGVTSLTHITGTGAVTASISGSIPASGASSPSFTVTLSDGTNTRDVTLTLDFKDPAIEFQNGDVITLTAGSNTATFTFDGTDWDFENDLSNPLASGDVIPTTGASLTIGALDGAAISCTGITLETGANTVTVTFTKTGANPVEVELTFTL